MRSTFSSLKNMFKVPDLRNKIIFTLVIVAVYRLGSWVPLPGIDFKALASLESASGKGGVLATGLAFVFHNGGGGFLGGGQGLNNIDLIPKFTVGRVLLIVLTMTAGTAFVMWLGERKAARNAAPEAASGG